jgi:hypothetical protein
MTLLALTERRTDEQIEADAEIERISRDEPDELIRYLHDGIGAAGTFYDHWYKRNNLPPPPCPGCIARELLGRDLVAEATSQEISRQIVSARRQRRVELSALDTQLPLL